MMVPYRYDDPDDDDDFDDEPTAPKRPILIAAITAGVTTLVASLVTWGIDELRARFGTPKDPPTDEDSK